MDLALPPVAVLQVAVDTLHARGDSSAVVRVVEAWLARGEPTLRARLRQGIAFHRVRLLDRAMARALEVLKAEPRNTEALRLLAEVYLDRGWPSHARKPLATLRELGAEVDALWLRAATRRWRLAVASLVGGRFHRSLASYHVRLRLLWPPLWRWRAWSDARRA